jgi:hypothetical protein
LFMSRAPIEDSASSTSPIGSNWLSVVVLIMVLLEPWFSCGSGWAMSSTLVTYRRDARAGALEDFEEDFGIVVEAVVDILQLKVVANESP